jgi:Holliday junction DNA helicase RuvA
VIASLKGTVTRSSIGQIVLDVNGVGYLVNLTLQTSSEINIGKDLFLNIAHIVKEDSETLFGFQTLDELEAFQLLCSVNGVGPKSALAVLGQLGVAGIEEAVSTANDDMFRSVSGIGPKTAKLIVLSLTGKLVSGDNARSSANGQIVINALVGLGYPERQAKTAVDSVSKEESGLSEQELLKRSLAALSLSRKVTKDE